MTQQPVLLVLDSLLPCTPRTGDMAAASFDLVGDLGESAMDAECLDRYSQLARNFAVDALTAEVVGAFGREGIETLVLKGPVLAQWLYPGEVRPYVDSDLLVAPENRARAVGVLERLGFAEHCPWMPTQLSLNPGGTAFNRPGGGMVDLHCQLPGLDGDPDAIWGRLAGSAERQVIAGVELRVPDHDTVLLHVVLHAAHHANLVDGRDPTTCAGGHSWRGAAGSGWLSPTSGA